MQWYKHKVNSFNDDLLFLCIEEHGVNAYAIYHYLLEKMTEQLSEQRFDFEIKYLNKMIARDLCITENEVINVINSLLSKEIFYDFDNKIFGYNHIELFNSSMTMNIKFREIIANVRKEARLKFESREKRLNHLHDYFSDKQLKINL
ncbi:Lin1244/Lin1753 domain-containing protein [Spirochaeta dissipatitropha]